jgi:hypothetical protein
MKNVVVLGFRPGMHKAIEKFGLSPLYLSPVLKPGMSLQRDIIINDIESAEMVIRAIERKAISKIDGVLTSHEDGIFCAALLRSLYKTPGDQDFQKALYFRDKLLQKRLISLVDKTAVCMVVNANTNYASIVSAVGSPFVLKPSNGMSSKQTFIISDSYDYEKRKVADETLMGCIAESFISGEEHFADGVWEEGEVKWFSIGKYRSPLINTSSGNQAIAYLLVQNQHESLYSSIRQKLNLWLKALSAQSMVFHLEFFKNGDSFIFSECAARIAGGLIPEIIEITYNVNLYEIQIQISLGGDYKIKPIVNDPSGFIFFQLSKNSQNITKENLAERFEFLEVEYNVTKAEQNLSYGNIGYGIIREPTTQALEASLDEISIFSK